MCGASGSIVDRKTTSSRRVLNDEKLKIVDSAFTANGRGCTISTNCNKTDAFKKKKKRERERETVLVPAIHDPVWSKTEFCALIASSGAWWGYRPHILSVWLTECLISLYYTFPYERRRTFSCWCGYVRYSLFSKMIIGPIFFLSETHSPPHVARTVTPFLHTSPIMGENCTPRGGQCNPSRRFLTYSLFKNNEFSI